MKKEFKKVDVANGGIAGQVMYSPSTTATSSSNSTATPKSDSVGTAATYYSSPANSNLGDDAAAATAAAAAVAAGAPPMPVAAADAAPPLPGVVGGRSRTTSEANHPNANDGSSSAASNQLDDDDLSYLSSMNSAGTPLEDRLALQGSSDHRSPLVTTLDVETAALKSFRYKKQDRDRLNARWARLVARSKSAAVGGLQGCCGPTASSAAMGASVESHAREERAAAEKTVNSFYSRHMDGLVEQYLVSHGFWSALEKFRSHLPVEEQRFKTPEGLECYRRATSWHSANTAPQPAYEFSLTDIELLAMDSARRIRMTDDTLPWRPVDFESTELRLEPLEDEFAAAAQVASASEIFADSHGPIVGGSVMRLVEVLLLTEIDVPYTSGVPVLNFTNIFILLGGLFVSPGTIITLLIRFFRSVKEWGSLSQGNTDKRKRANFLQRRTIQCLSAYCIAHTTDLTFPLVQQMSHFVEWLGFASPLESFPLNNRECPGAKGAFTDAAVAEDVHHQHQQQRSARRRKSPAPPSQSSEKQAALMRQFSLFAAQLPSAGKRGSSGGAGQLSDDVTDHIISFSIFLQRFARAHYVFVPGGGESSAADGERAGAIEATGEVRARLGTMFISNPRPYKLLESAATDAHLAPAVDRGMVHPADISVQLFANQLCMLSFRMFSAVHMRELVNNSWLDIDCKWCCSVHLNDLVEYSLAFRKWVAAAILSPTTWELSRRTMQHFVHVCRALYDLQNYEMASALLDGVRHPSVVAAARLYEEVQGKSMLTTEELRELETLQGLLDPFASYSPSSLNSVMARAGAELDSPMLPLLAPILGVISRTEENSGPTTMIRPRDGQYVVNWTKVMAVGRMIVLLLRCQFTAYTFPIDTLLQDYLWSIKYHQWTDAGIAKLAARPKV